MQLSAKGKQLDVGDAFRTHVGDCLSRILGKEIGHAIEVAVTLAKERHRPCGQSLSYLARDAKLRARGGGEPGDNLQDGVETGEPPGLILGMSTEMPSQIVAQLFMRLNVAEFSTLKFRNRSHSGLRLISGAPTAAWAGPTRVAIAAPSQGIA